MLIWPKDASEPVEGEDDLKSGVVAVGEAQPLAHDEPVSDARPDVPSDMPSEVTATPSHPPAHQRAALVRQALLRGVRPAPSEPPPAPAVRVTTPIGLAAIAPPRAPKTPR